MSQKVKLLISYDGTNFGGWQKQASGPPTIQGSLEQALSRLFDEPVSIKGAGRTDAGVHACGQVAHFIAPKPPEKYNLVYGLNSLLPSTISIQEAWLAPDEFHATFSATQKTYKYSILNSQVPRPLKTRFATWLRRPLKIEQLQAYTEPLIGRHDFKSFRTMGTTVRHTVREIFSAHWTPIDSEMLEFTVVGSGFLKQMVRNIVGTILDLQKNDAPPHEMLEILQKMDRQAALGTAAPQGLQLYSVEYPEELDRRCRKI